jgi:hypothetical protein
MYSSLSKSKSNSISKTVFGCATAALLITGTALAQDTTETESFSIGAPLQTLSPSGDFTLPDFNTSLGTLESVDITLSIRSCSTIEVFNTSSNPQAFSNASLSLLGSVTGPNGLELNTTLDTVVPTGLAQSGINSLSTGKEIASTQESPTAAQLSLWENQAGGVLDFSYVKGNPTFQGTDVGGDNLLFGGNLKAYGDVTVEYTYLSNNDPGTPLAAPEPSGKYLSGLAAGAMALMLFGRRRLSKS